MTVARALYSDLILSFTPTAAGTGATTPNQTEIANGITLLYKNAYRVIGAVYAAYSASAEHAIIDTEECKSEIISAATRIVQGIHDYVSIVSSAEKQKKFPSFRLEKEEVNAICMIKPATIRFASREDTDSVEIGDNVS
jgi:hypothetical protein